MVWIVCQIRIDDRESTSRQFVDRLNLCDVGKCVMLLLITGGSVLILIGVVCTPFTPVAQVYCTSTPGTRVLEIKIKISKNRKQ